MIGAIDRETKHHHFWHQESDIEFQGLESIRERDVWWVGDVYDSCRPVNTPDLRALSFSRAAEMAEAGFRSHLVVPILQEDRCIAHLSLMSTREAAFSDDQVQLLASVAGHLGSAIRNAALYGESEERRRCFPW